MDKLLFANVNPVYKNPELVSFKFYNTGLKNNVIDGNINGYLQYQVNNNDRTPTVNYKLIVVYNDNTQINFDDTDSHGEITFNFIWSNIKHIKLTQIFLRCHKMIVMDNHMLIQIFLPQHILLSIFLI